MRQRHILVIGYGNEIRSDDGAGLRVAEGIEALDLAGVRVIACHQLTPDLAEAIAEVAAVFFADAKPAADGAGIEITSIGPDTKSGFSLHSGSPAGLLALAVALYGCCPPAWCVAIPAVSFDLGQTLSTTTNRGVVEAVMAIRDRAADLLRSSH